MRVGPLDSRKRRLRCIGCSSSHLKCSGKVPCENCVRRGTICKPPARDLIVRLESPRPNTASRKCTVNTGYHLHRPLALDEQSTYVRAFFAVFLARNNFTGRLSSSCLGLEAQVTNQESLFHAVSAIGARQTVHYQGLTERQRLCRALSFYSAAVTALRSEIAAAQARGQQWTKLSWSTFLLGLYELMSDHTGQNWLWHMLHGTSKILQLLTPKGCLHGAGRVFFLEVRVFELARAMLFSERTFLSTKPWRDLASNMWESNYQLAWSPKEQLLDTMVDIHSLCIRAADFTDSREDLETNNTYASILVSLAAEGFKLRNDLACWKIMAQQWRPMSPDDHQMTIASIFHSAISIYLSGTYDYSSLWDRHHLSTPNLDQSIVAQHVENILTTASRALKNTNITGLIFLFPLRIAGARTLTTGSRTRITQLLKEITQSFKAAGALLTDLEERWAHPHPLHCCLELAEPLLEFDRDMSYLTADHIELLG